MVRQIENLEDIKLLVNTFYDKVRKDDLLADIFNQVVQDNWPKHLEKMYRFWQTVLLADHTYYGSPFLPHAQLPVQKTHFDRWLKLFVETLNEHFVGKKKDEAKWRAERMANMFYHKIEFYRNNTAKPLL